MNKSVLIIAEHKMVGEFLTTFLQEHFKGFAVFKASTMKDALELLHSISFDLVFAEVLGVDNSIISAIKKVSLISPKTRCLLLSAATAPSWVDLALGAGAWGFLTKTCSSAEIVNAVNALIQGRTYLSPDVIQRLADSLEDGKSRFLHSSLSPREFEIFVHLGQGKSLKSISSDLKLSSTTVAVHKHNIGKKTGIKSTAKIAHYCIEHGLLSSAA